MATTEATYLPLESGDRLTRAEFHRRYCARPDIKKAELVKGVVYVPSPVRHKYHSRQHMLIGLWLGTYATAHPELDVSGDATIFMGDDTEVQPDAALFRMPSDDTPVRMTDEGYVVGAPELIVEVAASSAAYDLHDKLEQYREAGVQEYIVWLVLENRIEWLRLRAGRYVALVPNEHGIIESEVFPGLRMNVTAMLAGDRAAILAALQPAG